MTHHDPPTKGELRAAIRRLLAGVPDAQVKRQSNQIARHLLVPSWLLKARVLVAYAPLAREADVRFVAAAWALRARSTPGVRLCLPRLDWASRLMEAVEVRDWDRDLVPVRHAPGALPKPPPDGLLEPRPGLPVVPLEDVEIVLVPGLAFDRRGGRLGRGVGFYDRFLARLPARAITVGVALDGQVVESVPTEPHDVRVAYLATTAGVVPADAPRRH